MDAAIALRVTAFLAVFAAALVAIVWPRRASRQLFGVVFVTLFAVAVMSGRIVWPFFHWHLFDRLAPVHRTFFELRVADARGGELRFDYRAAPPTLTTPLNRLAEQMVTSLGPHASQEIAAYLVARAETYRRRLAAGERIRSWAAFPEHQHGFTWSSRDARHLAAIVELRVYRVDFELSADGTRLESRREERVASFR